MAALDTVRALIRDTKTVKRFTDEDLEALMTDAMNDLNVWANTTWTIADLDTDPTPVPLSHQQIFYVMVKIRVVDSELTNLNSGIKMVTQDVQLDTSGSVARLNRTKLLLEQELDKKLTYWLGIKSGAIGTHVGDQWGGA
jgi:hypothetical protein